MAQKHYPIKRYNNRRLYDPAQKRFLNLKDLRGLIRDGHRLKVEDANGHDITHQVLLQIVAECEESGQPLLSNELLHTLARSYGDVMQTVFGHYLDESVKTFLKQQGTWRGAIQASMEQSPMAAFNKIAEAQLGIWDSAHDTMDSLFGKPSKKPTKKSRK